MARAAKQPGVWGIDLGQCALKAIRLEKQDGEIVATAFDYVEHPKILGQPDADPDQLTREALEKFLSRNDLHGDTVAIGVPGQSGLARFVKLPPVDQRKIGDIVKFEAKQQIPFPLHEVVWGFQRLGKGTTSDNMILDAEVGLFAMKRDMISRALQHFKEVGIEVHYIQMAPLALCNFLAHDLLGKGAPNEKGEGDEEDTDDGKQCVVGLDIGTDNSNLVITDGGKIIWQRPIPLGGNHFTRALTKDLKLTFAKAEHLKRNAVKSPDLKKILGALKPVLNDFVSEVQRSLGYFTTTHRDATIKHMLGLGNAFRLPGLQKYLQEKLQLEVRKLQKINRLSGDDAVTDAPQYVENVLSFGVAHGLALQGLSESCIHVNLLPPEIAADRRIRAKKPWAVAAAATLLLLAPPLMLGWAAAKEAWENKGVDSATKQLVAVVDTAKKQKKELEEIESKAIESKEKVLSLAGGVNERLNWMHLYHFISEAVPRPDGTYLTETARTGARPYAKYFTGDPEAHGKEAYDKLKNVKDKLARGEALSNEDQKEEEWIKKNLVQVYIERVVALYTENQMKDYVESLTGFPTAYVYQLKGLREPEKDIARKKSGLPSKSKGWIIEIHGYTYHTDKDPFVENSFVENLVDMSEANLKERNLKNIKLHPKTEDVLREKDKGRITFVVLYDTKYDPNPRPNEFYLISKTVMANNLQVFGSRVQAQAAPAPVPAAGADPAAPPPVAAPPQGPQRNSWRPPSDTEINVTFQARKGGGGLPGAVNPFDKSTVVRAGRTEFIVLFFWQESIAP